jgi:hypothetical protein
MEIIYLSNPDMPPPNLGDSYSSSGFYPGVRGAIGSSFNERFLIICLPSYGILPGLRAL